MSGIKPVDPGNLGIRKISDEKNTAEIRTMKQKGIIPCETCQNRMYQDGSNDPGVSFKAAGHISPEASASVVMSHEREHVSNEKAKADTSNREIVAQSVQIYNGVCPECGKTYVAGGRTTTTTKGRSSTIDAKDPSRGEKFDMKI